MDDKPLLQRERRSAKRERLSEKQERLSEKQERGLWHYITVAVSGAVSIAVLVIATLAIIVPALVGGTALTVLTQSMEPRLPPGTLIIIRPIPIDEITVGDIVTYQIKTDEPAVISHRVISRSKDTSGNTTFITKGDSNSLADPLPVLKVQIKGTLWYSIPWLGFGNNFIGGQGRAILVPTVAAALFAYAGSLVVSSIRSALLKRRLATAAAVGGPHVKKFDVPHG